MSKLSWSSTAIAVIPIFCVHCQNAYISPNSIPSRSNAATDANGRTSTNQMRLLEIINQALPHIERFAFLSHKWEDEGLSEDERAELLAILGEREAQNAERARAVQEMSELDGESFENLWKRLMGEAPMPLVPRN